MEEIITKETAQKLMKELKGEVRGISFKAEEGFILREKGEKGLKLLEDKMARLGYPIKYREIKPMDFYPIGLKAIAVLAIKKVFDFSDETFEEIGAFGTKMPLIIKLFMKYLGSVKVAARAAPKMWRRYYTVGDLKTVDFNEEKRYIVLRLENFWLVTPFCLYLKGYFRHIVEMVVKSKANCEETKCPHRGDGYHEFLVKW
jgi:hypothetical protein